MSKPIQCQATVGVFLSGEYNARLFDQAMRNGDHEQAARHIVLSIAEMDSGQDPWMRIGSAVATVTMLPNFALRHEQIKALEAALQKDRAESHARQTAMLGEINKLKAIENSGSAS